MCTHANVGRYAYHMEHLIHKLSCLMVQKMEEVVPTLCYGCLIDHPSQVQHDLCLMAEKEEQFYRTFSPAWEKLDLHKELDHVKKLVKERMEFVCLRKRAVIKPKRRFAERHHAEEEGEEEEEQVEIDSEKERKRAVIKPKRRFEERHRAEERVESSSKKERVTNEEREDGEVSSSNE